MTEEEYNHCPNCKRWCYSVEKLHCWICPNCRNILKYKEVLRPVDKNEE